MIKGTGTMAPADWMVRWAEGLEPTPPQPDPARHSRRRRRHAARARSASTFAQYLSAAPRTGRIAASRKRSSTWPSLNARSKFWGDDQRAAFKNWEEITSLHNPPKGIAENIQRRELLRRILMKVIQDNKLDLLIQLHTALPPGKIGLAPEPNAQQPADLLSRSDRTLVSPKS